MTNTKRWIATDDLSSMPPRGAYRVYMRLPNGATKTYPGSANSYSAEIAVWTLRQIHNKTGDAKMQYIEQVK